MSGLESNSIKARFPIKRETEKEPATSRSFGLVKESGEIVPTGERVALSRSTSSPEIVHPTKVLPLSRVREAIEQFDADADFETSENSSENFAINDSEPLSLVHDSEAWLQSRVIAGDANATICFQNALVLIENNEFELAKNLLGAVVNSHSQSPQALYWLGHCFSKLNQLEQALFCFQALREIKNDEDANFRLADIYYRLNQDEAARNHYMQAVDAAQVDGYEEMLFEAYKNIGNIMMRTGDIESAVESYHKAHRLSPESDIIEVNLGTACLQSDDLNRALEHFRQAVQINPVNDRAWVGLAMAHRMLSDMELSWANLQRALECNGGNRTAMLLFVEWAKQDGKIASTLENLQNYLEENESDAEMIFLHAQILYACGRNWPARLELERAMAMEPLLRGGDTLLQMIRKEERKSA